MTNNTVQHLLPEWKERLGLLHRRQPEFYETSQAVVDVPHALAIRAALDDLGLSAVFCVQGVPTVAILSMKRYDRATVIDLHGALWNQGLASLLLVIANDTLRVFSLGRTPYRDDSEAFDRRCLIETLDATADALRVRNLLYETESGRLWKEHSEFFKPKERIDQVLLGNLKETHRRLCNEGLPSGAAQAALIQAMFIAYLEDRRIITDRYFQQISQGRATCFISLLETGSVQLLKSLFESLRKDFNGDLFVAPCSFERQKRVPKLRSEHLKLLERFRCGREEMAGSGQRRFWGYDFHFIPIELVSAVYDQFLGEKEQERKEKGAYYTPMFLADTVVSQVWETITPDIREQGRYLDPACGSGVFLVRSFQRLCEHWRATRRSRTIRWDSLRAILQRVHGWDINGGAVRVAVFSLYVALLEEVSPPDIRRLISRGKILPELWGKTLVCQDFFEAPDKDKFDVIVGNPPWSSRRGAKRPSVIWARKHSYPMPSNEDAWAFAWKAGNHLAPNGIVALLLPAMGFLHNHAASTVAARNRFIQENRIFRIINFADMRFQLFEHAHRPAALIVYGASRKDEHAYRFDYWAPKADLNLRIKRLINLSSSDKLSLNAVTAMKNPLAFKQRLWMREPDLKLFEYLSRLPRLGNLVRDFGGLKRRKQDISGQWVIGQGYQPFNPKEESGYSVSRLVGRLPDLPISGFRRLAQPVGTLSPWKSSRVRRKGFEPAFKGNRVLIPRGVETSQNRLRAAYTNANLTFQDVIQAIVVPVGEERRGKLLTALLNSKIAVWYAFHGTASYGSDRPEVKQAELLKLPFPSPKDLPDQGRAKKAGHKLVALIESAEKATNELFTLGSNVVDLLGKIDDLAYEYFCLSNDEVALIEDTVNLILPAVQPHEGAFPALWKAPTKEERKAYADTLIKNLAAWFDSTNAVSIRLEAHSDDLGIIRLSLDEVRTPYMERGGRSIAEVLERLATHIGQPLDGNFQLVPDLRIFAGKYLYFIKPMQLRFWMRSAALTDADAIAMDLQDIIDLDRRESHA